MLENYYHQIFQNIKVDDVLSKSQIMGKFSYEEKKNIHRTTHVNLYRICQFQFLTDPRFIIDPIYTDVCIFSNR